MLKLCVEVLSKTMVFTGLPALLLLADAISTKISHSL